MVSTVGIIGEFNKYENGELEASLSEPIREVIVKECIKDGGSDVYEETNYLFEVYPKGDKAYSLIAFKIYTYNVANSRAHPPNIRKVRSPGEDLTYLG